MILLGSIEPDLVSYIALNPSLTNAQIAALDANLKAIKYGSGITLNALTCKLSLVDGTAFVTQPSIDLRPYLGFKLSFSDGSKTLVGYAKAAGTGETLGSELVPNGDFEVWTDANTPGSWNKGTVGSSTINREASDIHGGSYCARFDIVSGAAATLTKSGLWTPGMLYKRSYWHKVTANSAKSYTYSTPETTFGVYLTLNATSWYNLVGYGTASVNDATLALARNTTSGDYSIYFDDISVKQVLTPSATGVTIVSAAGGTTYNWATQETGFNPNAAAFTVTITKE